MASVRPVSGGHRAQVYVEGVRDSKVFRTVREAKAWGAARETELKAETKKPPGERHTLRDALVKYRNEVSPKKLGCRAEVMRINATLNQSILPVALPLASITADHVAKWRDARLSGRWLNNKFRASKPGSVLRDFSWLDNVFEVARREWKWIVDNPVREVSKPATPKHREVIIQLWQVRRMLEVMGYSPLRPVRAVAQAIAVCFLVCLRTGIREGEAAKLSWVDVGQDDFHVDSKTDAGNRDVPLMFSTRRLFDKMAGFDPVLVFGVSAPSIDAMFRKYRKRAGLSGFTFHDSRHFAATSWAKHVDVLTLCKIFGWADPKEAMTYYNPTAADVARLRSQQLVRRRSAASESSHND